VSCCAHHFLPFSGIAWFLYIPNKRLIGASKPARIIDHYSARPQLQETLCHDVINAFSRGVETQGVMVVMKAVHACIGCRGARKSNSVMVTSAVKGVFQDPGMEEKGNNYINLSH